MTVTLQQLPQLQANLHPMPRLTSRLLQLGRQELHHELALLAEQNPLLELIERELPRLATPIPTLAEHLHEQLGKTPMTERLRADATRCVASINGRGYLPATAALALATGLSPTRASAATKAIRRLDPIGVGAHDLADCMALQLAAIGTVTPTVQAARRLVRDHFPALARRRHDLLPALHRQEALAVLTTLQPRFADSFTQAATSVTPDLEAHRNAGVWQVRHRDSGLPVRIDATLAKQAQADPAWCKMFRQANSLLGTLAFRQATLLTVAQALVDRQRGFFERGPAALVPIRLRDIAATTGFAISTVAATVQGKYLATPKRVLALKYLFQRDTGGRRRQAAASLQEAIKQLIANEDPTAPLSDQQIMLTLRLSGPAPSRRTVTKHRLAANLPAAHLRRCRT